MRHHQKEDQMSKVSKESAKEQISMEGLEVGLEHLESGFTVCFESHSADVDLEPLFRGLEDDRARCLAGDTWSRE